ncbi:MAG: RecT family recombinase [Aerococcus urinaeequi]
MGYNNKNNTAGSSLAVLTTPEITEFFQPEVLEVVRHTFCKDATDAEFLLFAHKAASYKLDPFKNEIFFIKYGTTARIQFAAEAYLAKAREKEGFQPPNTQMVCEKDEFQIAADENGDMKVVKHEITFPRGKIIAAYSIVRRDNFHPVTVIMDREEVAHQFTGQNKDNWNKWTTDMFGKHVEIRGLKKQYGLDFGDDDITQPEYQTQGSYERMDVTPQQEVAATREFIQEPEVINAGGNTEPEKPEEIAKLHEELKGKLAKLNVVTGKELKDYLKRKNLELLQTVESYKEVINMVDMDIEDKEMGGDPL